MHESAPALSVVKLGGSLLEMDGLTAALRKWLSIQRASRQLIVVGGGAIAETVRAADRRHNLGDAAAHRLAIEAMALNARLVAALLGDVPLIGASPAADVRGTYLFDSGKFLDEIEPELPGSRLPTSWDVTSDSIAAGVAVAYSADELVLLKNSLPWAGATPKQAAAEGYVDRYFPEVAASIQSIRCVNLRDKAQPERWLAR